jgi:hypothetical protein
MARAIIDFVWNNLARSHLVGNTQRITHAEQLTETRRAGNTGDPRSGRVAARGGGCATGACRHRANHRGPRFHAGESKGRPHLAPRIHQRDLPFRVSWCFTRDQPCNGLRVGNGFLIITAIETGGIDTPVAVLHVEKIPRHIQDRLLFIAKGAAPALCLRRRGGTAQATRPGGRCGPITKASILK